MEARKDAREDFKKWVLLEEISWRHKSREAWLKEGDRNTRFFHKMADTHGRGNLMARIKINGTWFIEENEIKEAMVSAFQSLLTDLGEWRPNLNGLSFELEA